MGPPPASPEPSRPDVVRPLSRVAARTCARPGCPSPASCTLSFRYEAREVHLADLTEHREPESYDLCAGHAERTGPPHGWSLEDRRTEPDDEATGPLGGERTVALLAQMLGRDRQVTADAATPPEPAQDQPRLFDRDEDGEARASAW